jgi:hypothetical protein
VLARLGSAVAETGSDEAGSAAAEAVALSWVMTRSFRKLH